MGFIDNAYQTGSCGVLACRRANSKAIFRINTFAVAVSAAVRPRLPPSVRSMKRELISRPLLSQPERSRSSVQILRRECPAHSLDSIAHTCATRARRVQERRSSVRVYARLGRAILDTRDALFIVVVKFSRRDIVRRHHVKWN